MTSPGPGPPEAATPSPRFSVVVPLYNKREFVLRAIHSVFDQSVAASEVVVVDDGSTDGAGAVVEDHFPEVTVLTQDNAGVGAARNRGAEHATSEWVAFLDADDVWFPDHLAELSRVARDAPAAGLISTQHEQVVHGEEVARSHPAPGRVREIDFFREAAERSGIIHSSCAAVRRSVLDDLGGFGPAPVGEDVEFWARIALHLPVAISEARTAVYVRGVGGTMDQRRASPAPLPVVDALDDVTPAHATVCAALRTGGVRPPRASLVRFLNGRTISQIKEALARGDVERARALRQLLQPPLQASWLAVAGLTFLPPRAASRLLGLARRRHR